MNGAVSKVNKKFISHFTRAKRTPSAAATFQVSHALPAVHFSCGAAGSVYNTASQQEKAFYVLLLRRHVVNWSPCPAVSMRSELLVAHAKL